MDADLVSISDQNEMDFVIGISYELTSTISCIFNERSMLSFFVYHVVCFLTVV